MFRKKKDDGEGPHAASDEAVAEGGDMDAPPLKPFSKKGSHVPAKPPSATAFRPDIPRRVVEIPGRPGRGDRGRHPEGDSRKLTVGREIRLNGQITSCDKLVVEGEVEASLTDARIIEVAPSGVFKGDAQVDEADISGRFEGELIARVKLTVRAGGRVSGSIRYGSIVIESGGEVSGDMQTLTPAQGGAAAAEKTDQGPAEEQAASSKPT